MRNLTDSAKVFGDQRLRNAEAYGGNLLGGLVEAPDDHDLRRFLDERKEQRRLKRFARPEKWEGDPPTPKQLAYLRFLGHRLKVSTKGGAAQIISRLVEGRPL